MDLVHYLPEDDRDMGIVPCEYVIRLGSLVRGEPPEHCEEESVPGEIHCARHLAMMEGE